MLKDMQGKHTSQLLAPWWPYPQLELVDAEPQEIITAGSFEDCGCGNGTICEIIFQGS